MYTYIICTYIYIHTYTPLSLSIYIYIYIYKYRQVATSWPEATRASSLFWAAFRSRNNNNNNSCYNSNSDSNSNSHSNSNNHNYILWLNSRGVNRSPKLCMITTVGFHNFNIRIFNLRVSNPNKLIVDVFLTRCRSSMYQGLSPKNTMKFRKSTVVAAFRSGSAATTSGAG